MAKRWGVQIMGINNEQVSLEKVNIPSGGGGGGTGMSWK